MSKVPKIIDTAQPFYSDILARSLLRINIPRYEAYQVAHGIWQQLSHQKKDQHKITERVKELLEKKYPQLIDHYEKWQTIVNKEKPLIILIGGGTGIGTSTLAMRVAWLLEINRIVSTDSVREVIRHFLPEDVMPVLHVSSYETDRLGIKEVKSEHDRLIYGFMLQSKEVLNGVEAIIKRSIREKTSIVIEGVHLIPGEMKFLEKYKKEATIIQIMLDVNQESKHLLHFASRHRENSNRKKERYLKYFKEIRMIREYLVKQAEKNHVLVVQNYDLKKAEKQILHKIYSQYAHKK
ncbi:hypothetical protein HZA43_02780 [Candidatus Peregrinibacteria bacterium]|nr:hypothetical protein [Candidatus Peregrinibacteria bacterium]